MKTRLIVSIRAIALVSGQNFPPLKTRFIVNPRSGNAKAALPAIRNFAAQHAAEVMLTERSRHASELTAQGLSAGCELIVAVGGDGTMNEIASVVRNTPAILGMVPCGSGDGLGRHLGIHGTADRALNILQSGRPILIDTAEADGHPFFTAAGIGFEAEIAQRFNRLARRGFFRYLTTSAKAFRTWEPEACTVTHGDRRETFRAFTLAVGNAAQYGNNALIAPKARVDDGQIDLCVIPPVGVLNALPLLIRLFNGTLDRAHGVALRQSDRFIVERPRPGPLHTDGELHEAGTRIEFRVLPKSLRIMVPQAPVPTANA